MKHLESYVERGLFCANMILQGKTIRQVANEIEMSKSSVQRYISLLEDIEPEVFEDVQRQFEINRQEGFKRGGETTRLMLLEKKSRGKT